jgi:hypothetical protein
MKQHICNIQLFFSKQQHITTVNGEISHFNHFSVLSSPTSILTISTLILGCLKNTKTKNVSFIIRYLYISLHKMCSTKNSQKQACLLEMPEI